MGSRDTARHSISPLLSINDATLEAISEIPKKLDAVYRSVLQEGTDYGKYAGVDKPSLWKAGRNYSAGGSRWCPRRPSLRGSSSSNR